MCNGYTDGLYIQKKIWDVLDEAILDGESQGKNIYESGGIFYVSFLAPKIKYCLPFFELGITEEHKTFKNSMITNGS